jgi:hypothetical protein
VDVWGECSLPCGGGAQFRTFAVSTPAMHGGACPADGTSETQACNTQACPPPPPEPVDCVGAYGDFGACSETCGPNGVQMRSFIITTPASHGGVECTVAAGAVETQPCNTAVGCPVDCVGAYGDFGACSATCGGGTQSRSYIVSTPASNGGTCAGLGTSETQPCNSRACQPACVTVNIGSMGDRDRPDLAVATVTGDPRYVCPTRVDRNNWLSDDTYDDWFAITHWANGGILVQRADGNGDINRGWGMNLIFQCCV